MSKIGTADIKGIMLGSTEIVKAYLGTDIVYQNAAPAPEGYEWCEYIENTSSAYINTGVKAKATHKFEAVVNLSERIVTGIFGAAYTHKPNCALLVRASMNATRSYLYYGGGGSQCSSMIAQNAKVTIVLDKGALTFNGTARATRSWGNYRDSAYNVHIFKAADYNAYCKMKLYSFKIWDNDVLIKDYRPVKRISDDVYGLWDMVDESFITSANSSTFTGG